MTAALQVLAKTWDESWKLKTGGEIEEKLQTATDAKTEKPTFFDTKAKKKK